MAGQQWKEYKEYGATPQQDPFMMNTTSVPAAEEFYPQPQDETSTSPAVRPASRNSHVRRKLFFWALRYFTVAVVIGMLLAIPAIITREDGLAEDIEYTRAHKTTDLVYWLFMWLVVTWIAAVVFDLIALALPYVFRLLARYINPAHQKYWRVFKAMRRPTVLLGTVVISYITFAVFINLNGALGINLDKDPAAFLWDDAIDDVLEQGTIWVALYFVEKIIMLYITIHYHSRADHKKITHSKDMHNALITLYEASVYLHPSHGGQFNAEDMLIRNAKGDEQASTRVRATSYLARMGIDDYKIASVFGDFISTKENSHWLRPASSYATVERALSNSRSAAALARRIWMSFVTKGSEWLTVEDIAEVLGPYRREEAEQIFKILDENESGDIRLDEMIMTAVEAGKIRHDIYRGMHDIDHCLNTWDWIMLTILAAVMVFFILTLYVPTIKQIQQTISIIAVGLAFALGRTFNHLFQGVIFVFFDHPFDVGDTIQVYNLAASISVSCVVKRQSLLYTVFRRLDNGTDLQISNERLIQKRIENISRSGINRQALSLFVSFKTSFQDIVYLRQELEAFLAAPEHRRDYNADLGLSIINLHELNKIELRVSVAHKSNWSNEKLRAARSNKFYCALVAAVRKIPLDKPGGALSTGEEGKPMYTVPLTDDAGAKQMANAAATKAASRIGAAVEPTQEQAAAKEVEKLAQATLARMPAPEKKSSGTSSAVELNEFIGISTTGLRNKTNQGAQMMFVRQ